MTSYKKPSVDRWGSELANLYKDNSFVVFLCGPSLTSQEPNGGSALRKKLLDELEADGFEVVLGEDDGLEDLRNRFKGMAHQNELSFIQQESGAIVLVADSVGSFCELGLFSYTHYADNPNQTDFILLLKKDFEKVVSYLNEGPKKAIESFGGMVLYDDFSSFDIKPVLDRLNVRRNVWFTQGKGKPKGK